MANEKDTTPFWVLEAKEVDLYFGMKCNKGHYLVGINSAIKFVTKEDAENAQKVLEELGLKFMHEPKEHAYFP